VARLTYANLFNKKSFSQCRMHYLMTDYMSPGVNAAMSICLQFNVTFEIKNE